MGLISRVSSRTYRGTMSQQNLKTKSSVTSTLSISSFWQRNCGAIYSVLSSLVLASTGVFVKKITSVSKTELAAFRVGGQYIFLLPYVLINHPDQVLPFYNWKIFRLLLGRGFFGIIAMICFYNSFEYLSIGETSTLMFCSAVVLTVCCWIFLGEKVDAISWV